MVDNINTTNPGYNFVWNIECIVHRKLSVGLQFQVIHSRLIRVDVGVDHKRSPAHIGNAVFTSRLSEKPEHITAITPNGRHSCRDNSTPIHNNC